ncbi:MAG: Putative Sensor histidine kinase [Nitrospira sp.]|nr:MAG: Putative Sensor histidine kinase [Nitrospira sp.]
MTSNGLHGLTTDKLTPRVRELGLFAFIAALCGGTFVLDCLTPRGIPGWVLYTLPIVLTAWTSHRWSSPVVAAGCTGLTFLGYVFSSDVPGVPTWLPQVNRSFSMILFPLIAYLVDRQKRLTSELLKSATMAAEHKALLERSQLLKKTAEEVQDLYDRAPCGYHSLDGNGLIVAMNQTEADWLGYTKEELIGKARFADFMTPASVDLFQERFPRFIQEGRVKDVEFEIVRKDGSVFTVLLSATAVTDPQGRYMLSRSTLIDITDRKQADQALRLSHQSLEALVQERTAALREANSRLERELAQSKQIHQALIASESRFRELIESLPLPIWTCLPDGTCDYLSAQWTNYTGRSADEPFSTGCLQHVHPEDRPSVTDQWREAVARAQPLDAELRFKRADGVYRWFHAHATPIRDHDGRVLKWVGTYTEIHDRKQAQEIQARLAAIVESSSDAVISKSLDGQVLTWNKSAELMFGYAGDEIIGQPISLIVPPERRAEEANLIEQITAGIRIQQFESVRIHKDGHPIHVSLTVSPIVDANGEVAAVSTIARDITERKRAEDVLSQQRRLIELSYDPIFSWDSARGILDWNRGCEQLYGYTRAEAVGRNSHALLKTTYPYSFDTICAELETTGAWTGEIHHRTKDGREVLVESRWGLLVTNGRRLILETNRDITERRHSELMILKKNKDLETLLYVTSHDLKEPLRAIESFSVLLQERYASRLDEKGQDFLRRIVRATQRLDRLLTDILDLSRAQRMEPPVDEIDADQLVQEVLRRLESRIKESGATITVCAPLPRLRVNTTWAVQGLYNLVSNALKFVSDGRPPNIEIAPHTEIDAEGTECSGLVVRDRGPGVPSDQRERIFELFRRAVGRDIEGTGAGLAIVRQVAERHGGRAWVLPRDGGGSDFFITFGINRQVAKEVGL